MSLADLVVMLGNMVRYDIFNPKSPLDTPAAKWAAKNKTSFPVDTRPLLTSEVKLSLGDVDQQISKTASSDEIEIKLL